MSHKILLAFTFALTIGVAQASASVQGIAVGGQNLTTRVGTLLGNGNIEYFIPLTSDGSTSGTYGVDAVTGGIAGTFSDSGSGFDYNPAGGLDMYIRYDLSGEATPSVATAIRFDFVDLDLVDINDPSGFFESIRFSYFDDDGIEQMLTDTLTDASDGFSYVAPGVSATVNSGGNNDPSSIEFTGLESIVNNIADAGGDYVDEFYLRVFFGSRASSSATNTAEELMSSAMTQADIMPEPNATVPEPSAVVVWLLLGVTAIGRSYRSER